MKIESVSLCLVHREGRLIRLLLDDLLNDAASSRAGSASSRSSRISSPAAQSPPSASVTSPTSLRIHLPAVGQLPNPSTVVVRVRRSIPSAAGMEPDAAELEARDRTDGEWYLFNGFPTQLPDYLYAASTLIPYRSKRERDHDRHQGVDCGDDMFVPFTFFHQLRWINVDGENCAACERDGNICAFSSHPYPPKERELTFPTGCDRCRYMRKGAKACTPDRLKGKKWHGFGGSDAPPEGFFLFVFTRERLWRLVTDPRVRLFEAPDPENYVVPAFMQPPSYVSRLPYSRSEIVSLQGNQVRPRGLSSIPNPGVIPSLPPPVGPSSSAPPRLIAGPSAPAPTSASSSNLAQTALPSFGAPGPLLSPGRRRRRPLCPPTPSSQGDGIDELDVEVGNSMEMEEDVLAASSISLAPGVGPVNQPDVDMSFDDWLKEDPVSSTPPRTSHHCQPSSSMSESEREVSALLGLGEEDAFAMVVDEREDSGVRILSPLISPGTPLFLPSPQPPSAPPSPSPRPAPEPRISMPLLSVVVNHPQSAATRVAERLLSTLPVSSLTGPLPQPWERVLQLLSDPENVSLVDRVIASRGWVDDDMFGSGAGSFRGEGSSGGGRRG